METGRKRIRKDFAPLTVSVSLACSTAFSPVTQVFHAAANEYEPDRSITPTVLQPSVIANASDGSWPTPNANAQLANMKWYVNGVDITTLQDWTGLYTIDTVGAARGTLTIYRNLTPSERLSLHFEADLVDNRLGVTHAIKTDAIVLSTVDQSADNYGISIGESKSIYYNPFLDKLFRYEYKVSTGQITASDANRNAAIDENSYLRTIPVTLCKGADPVTSGYTLKLYRIVNSTTFTELAAGYEVVSIAPSGITLDLRLIEKDNYLIKAFIGTTEVAQVQCSVSRLYQPFSCSPTNESAIVPGQTMRYDIAQVDSEGKIVECPECIIAIVWYTTTAAKSAVRHNEGGNTAFELEKTGIGDTYLDDWLETYVDAIQKEALKVAVDENGDELVDENGNLLIFN